MPAVYGQQYEAIPTDRVYPYSQDNPPPNCEDGGQTKAPYEQVAGNAFYCSNGDFVAYDEQGLLPKLRDNFGEFAVGLVFAHELGHAVQARVGYNPPSTVYIRAAGRLLRRCVGAARRRQRRLERPPLASDLDTALAGLLTLSDPSGIDGSQDGAHGNGFDRVSAFQDGYEGGARGVRRLSEQPALDHRDRLHQLPGPGDRGQPAPRRDDCLRSPRASTSTGRSQSSKLTAPTVTAGSVDAGNGTDGGVLTDAVVYDPSTNTMHYDAAALQNVHDTIGDFAGGLLLATAWSSAVEHQLGVQLGTTRPPRRRVPGRGLGGRHRVVAVARRPRRSGHHAGRRPARATPTGAPRSTGWPRSVTASGTGRPSACSRADSSPQLARDSGACATTHTPRSSHVSRASASNLPLTGRPYNRCVHELSGDPTRRPRVEQRHVVQPQRSTAPRAGCSSPRTTRACATRSCGPSPSRATTSSPRATAPRRSWRCSSRSPT